MSISIPRTPRARGRAVLACAITAAVAATGVPADAHNTTITATVQHGSTSHGMPWGERLTVAALKQSGCTSTVLGGTDVNNFDASVVSLTGLANHKVSASYTTTIEGTPAEAPKEAPVPAIYLDFVDKSCKPVALLNKEKVPFPYKQPTAAITVPPAARWLIVSFDAEGRSATYKLTVKHPPPPPKKKKK